jgi:two-component system, OmpR family, response regulator
MLAMPTTLPDPTIPAAPILVVDDDAKIVRLVRTYLERDGFSVVTAADGPAALDAIETHAPALVVLDLMLPGLDGRAVIRAVRRDAEAGRTPIIILSARSSTIDRIAGLEDGADDYLPKPFSFAELLARLRALARRGTAERPVALEVGDLRLDPATRQVWRGETEIELSGREFAVLETFMRRPGDVLSRVQLLEHAWDYAYESRSNVVDVYVRYLREKIDRPFGCESIETVRGIGYRLRKDGGA